MTGHTPKPAFDANHWALLKATRAFVAWLETEDRGPDYGSLSRDTHPQGEQIWREWWERNQTLCDEALELGRAAADRFKDVRIPKNA